MYEWCEPIIEMAAKKGIKVDRIDGKNVVRPQVISRMQKLEHSFIFLNGHGSSKCFFGHQNELVIGMDDADILDNRIVFTRACNCLVELGRKAVEKHDCISFIGYEFEFVNVRQTNVEVRPRDDEISRPIWEVSNTVPISLIKGAAVSESVEASHKRATREMLKLLYSKEPGAKEALKAIIINDEGLKHHGDGSARI